MFTLNYGYENWDFNIRVMSPREENLSVIFIVGGIGLGASGLSLSLSLYKW